MTRQGNFWLGVLIGTATGAVSALLLAPKCGEEMRSDIQSKARETGRKAGEAWSDVKEGAAGAARSTGERARSMVGHGKDMVSSARGRAKEAFSAGREAAEQKKHDMESQIQEAERKAEKSVSS